MVMVTPDRPGSFPYLEVTLGESVAQKRRREAQEQAKADASTGPAAGTTTPEEVVDPEVEQARKDEEYDALDAGGLVANLAERGLDQETKDRLNAALAETGNDPEVATNLLRQVAKALDRGEELPVPALPAATGEEDEDGPKDEEGGPEPAAVEGAPPSTDAPADGEGAVDPGDRRPDADADPGGDGAAGGGEDEGEGGLPFADLGYDKLIEMIREEGGNAAIDNIDQAVAFLPTESYLPYLRRFLTAVLDETPMPNLEPHLREEADQVATEQARKFAIASDDDPPARGYSKDHDAPPPLERPPVGDEVLAGFRVGNMVRVATEDNESVYNGHLGFIDQMHPAGSEEACEFTVSFGDDPSRPAERFPFGALTKVEG